MDFKGLILIVLAFAIKGCSSDSDCTSTVKIVSEEVFNYLGRVSFFAPSSFKGQWVTEVDMDASFGFIGGWDVWVNSSEAEGKAWFRSRKNDIIVIRGDEIRFDYRVYWTPRATKPTAAKVIWNGMTICKSIMSNEISQRFQE